MTNEQLQSYFSSVGIDYNKLSKEDQDSVKDTTHFKMYELRLAWYGFGISLKECANKIKQGFSKVKL